MSTSRPFARPKLKEQQSVKKVTVAAEQAPDAAWPGTNQWSERETAVDALRRIGPAALPTLVELLHGSDPKIRAAAARGIALMGPAAKAAVPDLEAALSDTDPIVRKNVIRALGQMGPAAESAVSLLVQEIHRPGPVIETVKETVPRNGYARPSDFNDPKDRLPTDLAKPIEDRLPGDTTLPHDSLLRAI